MRRRGYGPDAVEAAREVTDATAAVVASHFRSGYERLAAVKARHASEPWLREIRGEYTGDLLRASEAELRAHGRERHDNLGVPFPDLDHGIVEFVEGVDGARRRMRFADGYFRLMAD
jgi:hypothetical protein